MNGFCVLQAQAAKAAWPDLITAIQHHIHRIGLEQRGHVVFFNGILPPRSHRSRDESGNASFKANTLAWPKVDSSACTAG